MCHSIYCAVHALHPLREMFLLPSVAHSRWTLLALTNKGKQRDKRKGQDNAHSPIITLPFIYSMAQFHNAAPTNSEKLTTE